MTIKYRDLTLFSNTSFLATKANWEAIAGSDAFNLEYGPIFDWIDERVGKTHLDVMAYGIFEAGSPHASGIVEIINSSKAKGPMIKMLKVIISPQFWDISVHREEILKIFLGAIAGCIILSKTKRSKVLKLYGRSNELFSILVSLHTSFVEEPIDGLTAKIEGRWLVLE